ncbi:uncharacterized protein CC84DRAFT_412004 [Paraphaeosphaeria sporulosa]|uniref:Uncharacterized protein n=1 Tax=Paraphaeosphaeria sporulosa TaxID=1460663 RepID=A0A177BUJ9_9PLEO|nr:uncharacterized protein CC84DRAFT_412004 [Paraphaeosphaeria sporulosa]OAF98964.1 hypothetical protein CC84DRAFT_412004 [Paraphaeosphaeria sporulosa]
MSLKRKLLRQVDPCILHLVPQFGMSQACLYCAPPGCKYAHRHNTLCGSHCGEDDMKDEIIYWPLYTRTFVRFRLCSTPSRTPTNRSATVSKPTPGRALFGVFQMPALVISLRIPRQTEFWSPQYPSYTQRDAGQIRRDAILACRNATEVCTHVPKDCARSNERLAENVMIQRRK